MKSEQILWFHVWYFGCMYCINMWGVFNSFSTVQIDWNFDIYSGRQFWVNPSSKSVSASQIFGLSLSLHYFRSSDRIAFGFFFFILAPSFHYESLVPTICLFTEAINLNNKYSSSFFFFGIAFFCTWRFWLLFAFSLFSFVYFWLVEYVYLFQKSSLSNKLRSVCSIDDHNIIIVKASQLYVLIIAYIFELDGTVNIHHLHVARNVYYRSVIAM